MQKFTIQVSDRRGKYAARTYAVEADEEFLAYGEATERFIKDNHHRPRGPSERMSSYYSRFWNEVVPAPAANQHAELKATYDNALLAACALATPEERRAACDTAHIRYEEACAKAGIALPDE
jgi:hypothetical protein